MNLAMESSLIALNSAYHNVAQEVEKRIPYPVITGISSAR